MFTQTVVRCSHGNTDRYQGCACWTGTLPAYQPGNDPDGQHQRKTTPPWRSRLQAKDLTGSVSL